MQICSMVIFAIIIPLYIGLEQYGRFSAIFATCGFFIGLIETYLTMIFLNGTSQKQSINGVFLLSLLSIFLIFPISVYFLNTKDILFPTLIFIFFLFKNWFTARLYTLDSPLKYLLLSEAVYLSTYLIVLSIGYILGVKSYLTPIYMLLSSTLFSSIFLYFIFPEKKHFEKKTYDLISIKDLFGKLYEDLFITVSPLLIMNFFSESSAGLFRIFVTIMKGFSKVFPYRYELIILDFKYQRLNYKFLYKSIFIFIIFGFFLFIFSNSLFKYIPFLKQKNVHSILLCSLGFVITLLNIYPLIYYLEKRISLFLLLCFLSQFFLFNSISFLGYQLYFIIINAFLLVLCLLILKLHRQQKMSIT